MSNLSPSDFGRVAVLMGGEAAERDISLESGNAVLSALLRAGIDAVDIDWQGGIPQQLCTNEIDRVFNIVHGRGGEDGVIQGVLETLKIPYTGSSVLGSALAMDKAKSKQIWAASNIQTPKFMAPENQPDPKQVIDELGLPLMVKPACEGSSFGASRVDQLDQLLPAWHEAKKYDDSVLIEQWITGGEYTVGILNGHTLPLIKLETERTFYDYQAKYEDDTTRYICPCGLGNELEKNIQALALEAFELLNCSGWGRVDVMLDQQQQPYFIEANTIPGMTSHSLVPMAAKHDGMDFDQLVIKVLESSLWR